MSDEHCSICLNAFDSAEETHLECGHRFHTACALHWFRSGHSECPLCRNKPDTRLRFMDVQTRAGMLRKMSRRKDAPSRLKAAVKKLQDVEADLRATNTELKRVRKLPEVQNYFSLQSKRWRLKGRQTRARSKLGLMTGRDIPQLSMDIVREPAEEADIFTFIMEQ